MFFLLLGLFGFWEDFIANFVFLNPRGFKKYFLLIFKKLSWAEEEGLESSETSPGVAWDEVFFYHQMFFGYLEDFRAHIFSFLGTSQFLKYFWLIFLTNLSWGNGFRK